MKILMLTCNNTLQDGINRHILAIAPALQRLPHCEVAVCTTFVAGELNCEMQRAGVRAYALGLPHGHDLRTWWRFGKVMHEFNPDLIHAHVLGLFTKYYLNFFYPKLPIVYTCHGITDVEIGLKTVICRDKIERVFGRISSWFSLRRRQCTVYVSEGVKRLKGASDAPVIYNPIAFEDKSCSRGTNVIRMELGLSEVSSIIGTVCRVSAVKCPFLFVDVMCRVLQQVPTAHAVVCGTSQDASLMSSLHARTVEFGVGSRFHWLGYRKDACQVTCEMDCFIMTSESEGMPTALLEAMSVRTPIAFMRGRGGLVDLDELNRTEGPIGIVVDAGDCDGMSREIVDLLGDADRARKLSERAFACGLHHFNVETTSKKLMHVYASMMRSKELDDDE